MLTRSLPRSVSSLLERFRGCFTAPTFEVFCALTVGFWAQPQAHTVTGMLVAAGLSATWHHSRAHRFFSKARWSADQLGLVLLELILAVLVPADAPVRLVVDDTLMRRAGRKIFGAAWHHDPLGVGRNAIAWGNNWVVLGVLVDLPFVPHRPVCLPILARLWRPGHTPGRLDLAVELVKVICGHLGTRRIDLVCDGAYAGRQLRDLPAQVTVCCRLRADAALHRLAPPRRPGTRGRPRTRGDRLPELCTLAGLVTTPFALHQVTRYGQGGLAAVACFACLWPAVFGTRPVQVVLVRAPDAPDGFDLALVTTDLAATPAELVQRYAARWQVEMVFPQLAKARVRALGCGGQRVADLDLAVGHDHPVDEQLHQQPPLGERGRGQPVPDGPAETLDPVGDSAKLQPLLRDRVQLVLLVGQGGPAALQLPSLALELAQGDDLGQVGVQQPLLLALQLRDGLADGALAGVQLLRQPLPTTGPRQRRGNLGRISQQRGQVSPDQLVQLRGGGVAGGAALPLGAPQRVGAAHADVVVVAVLGRAGGARQAAGARGFGPGRPAAARLCAAGRARPGSGWSAPGRYRPGCAGCRARWRRSSAACPSGSQSPDRSAA